MNFFGFFDNKHVESKLDVFLRENKTKLNEIRSSLERKFNIKRDSDVLSNIIKNEESKRNLSAEYEKGREYLNLENNISFSLI